MTTPAPWYDPRPGTTAHRIRSAVRCAVWSAAALLPILMADPYSRAAILSAFGA